MDVKLGFDKTDTEGRWVTYTSPDHQEEIRLLIARYDTPGYTSAVDRWRQANRKAIDRGKIPQAQTLKAMSRLQARHIWLGFEEKTVNPETGEEMYAFTGISAVTGEREGLKDTEDNRYALMLYSRHLREFIISESEAEEEFRKAEADELGKKSRHGSPGAIAMAAQGE